MKGRYQIAAYIRLSKEDDTESPESNSVAMQRILLQRYAEEHFSDYELLEFCDDGYSGTNLERPGMRDLLELVKAMKINCIIVKDFSRFARDYIELGSYLEQILPFMGVRFISVNDKYDSMQSGIGDLTVNFQTLVYDLYSKDLSKKVRSSLAARKIRGEYISAHSPFGYQKDPNDRHSLLIAGEEAEIVRKIFDLAAQGHTSSQIARLFNETNVKTPMQFRTEKGETDRKPKGNKFLWSPSVICRILRNEIYIGNAVQNKTSRGHVGGGNRLNPPEDRLIARGHHEAVIDRTVFEIVRQSRGNRKSPQSARPHPFTGKLVCGCCGRSLTYRRTQNPYFSCCCRYSSGLGNCVKKVNAMFLEQYVLFRIQQRGEEKSGITVMSRETVNQYVEKILVYGEQNLELVWKQHDIRPKVLH